MSALYWNTATTVEIMDDAASKAATIATTRATPSMPGNDRKVTDALNTIAA